MVKRIESLRRGLRVLDVLFEDGPLDLAGLSDATGLPKATLLRILETLRDGGHVRRGLGDRLWHATTVRHGSRPTPLSDVVAEVSAPVIHQLCGAIQWPSDVGIYEDARIRIVETSRLMSPFLSHRLINRRVHVLPSAMGRAILAWTNQSHRDAILKDLAERGEGLDRLAQDRAQVDEILAKTRAKGYAERLIGYVVVSTPDAEISAVAVPILFGDRAIAAVTLSWMSSAMTEAEFVRSHLDRLRDAARQIESGLADRPVGLMIPGQSAVS